MRFEQLEYIAAVVEHGSLRRASEQLHISQPALSEAVSKLERELGVTLLDRRRSGARISRRGRDQLENLVEELHAVDRLRTAAGDVSAASRSIRIGTVSAATSTLLAPALRDFRQTHPSTTIEVVNTQQAEIHQGLAEGSLDLGLVNMLEGDDPPDDLAVTALVDGRPVAVLPANHELTARDEVCTDELRREPFVAMRAGYLMHRFAHRLFGGEMPPVSCTTDGAELGKVMVAEGLGFTVLPDFSVTGDPLEQAGIITHRPIADSHGTVALVLCLPRSHHAPRAVRDLRGALLSRARDYGGGPPTGSADARTA